MFCRFAGVVEEGTPALLEDVVLYQILHALSAPCRSGAASFLAMFGFLVLGVRRQAAKVGDGQSTVIVVPRRLCPLDLVGRVVAVTEMLVKCDERAGQKPNRWAWPPDWARLLRERAPDRRG